MLCKKGSAFQGAELIPKNVGILGFE